MYFNLLWAFMLPFSISVSGLNFNVDEITKISLDNVYEADGSYFGYSLLLQKGLQPLVIVGAPKQSNITGGAVFACDIINNLGCTKYDMATTNLGSFNGNFLGAAIDGDDTVGNPFVACAPRKVTQIGTGPSMNYFLKGSCFYHKNSSHFVGDNVELMPLRNEVPISNVDGQYYYNFAFGQAGIDAVYVQDSSSIILGAPGIKNWNGAILIQSLKALTDHQIIPRRDVPEVSESYDYLGYKVGGGNIVDTQFYFAGAPRADNLVGSVKLYTAAGLYRSFKGEEIGSFFGSAVLAEDVNDDEVDDLFIGAPMAAGSSFDEGCVYFYKNALSSSVKLVGRRRGARFGSNIVALGDIDLDSYNDIAISAPYEDEGVGAVYIFMGSADGIETSYSQRLSPSSFPGFNAKGFGMGISRGNDIDGNGHNDLAIGAYKTGHVLVIRTKSVIDFRTALESNVSSITSNDDQMSVRYCVYYKPRSNTQYLKTVDFQMKIILDYRVKGEGIHVEKVTAYPQTTRCNQIDVTIEKNVVDIVPFRFILSTAVMGNVMAEGSSVIEKSIPYAHGCGDDNICQTKIEINTLADTNSIILGLNNVIEVKVSAVNLGEPGYQCKLLMQMSKELELREKRKCTFENSTYICPFASKIDTEQEKGNSVIFDMKNININVKELEISFEVKCLGENIENKQILKIAVSSKNFPYIEGKSVPEDFEYNDENKNQDTEVEIYHTFTLGNFGPSPVKADVFLLLPIVKFGQEDLFQFIEAGGNLKGVHVPCYPTNVTKKYDKNYNVSSVITASLSRTVVFDCFEENSKCMELICQGDYLYKSSEIAKYILRFKTTTSLLAKFFQNQEKSKNILAYISSAYLFNGTRIESHAATLILFAHSSPIPLWVYIVSSISGVVLLGLIILLFYKCHFFDRRYRDKMNGERLMDLPIEMDTDTPKSQEVREDDTQEDRYE